MSSADLKDYTTLDEAVAWLSAELGKVIGSDFLLHHGSAGSLRFFVGIPTWEAPGIGELNWFDPKAPEESNGVPMFSDGYAILGPLGIRRLMSGRRASLRLCHLPRETGEALRPASTTHQDVGIEDIRIQRDELTRFAEANKSLDAKAQPQRTAESAQRATHDVELAGAVVHSTKPSRRDSIDPIIEQAQTRCKDKKDTAEVWAQMLVLAESKSAHLRGASAEGIHYLKEGVVAYFTRDALNKRLHPDKRGKSGKKRR
jgi:hypothetical protein